MKAFQNELGDVLLVAGRRATGFSLSLPGFHLPDCRAVIELSNGQTEPVSWSSFRRAGRSTILSGRTRSGAWELTFKPERNSAGVAGIRLDLRGRAAKNVDVARLSPLVLGRLRSDHLLAHGRTAGECRAFLLAGAKDEPFESSLQLFLTRGGITLQLCQPLRQRNPSQMTGRVGKGIVTKLAVSTPVNDRRGAALRSEPLTLFAGGDGHALAEAWADGQAVVRKEPVAGCGWNSWDYYRWTVTEDAVLRNAEFIAADPVLRRHVKRIIIDDGWQYCYGEWDANPLFPHGMKRLAGRIAKLGFEPGLWIAPGVVEPHSRIAQMDADMLAKGLSGFPCLGFNCMERRGFLLDPTVSKTRRWIYDLFARYAEMGYRYFKLDFLIQTLNAPVFSDPAVPRGEIVRKLIEPVADALRGRARIMGCGYDFHAGTDLVDEVRTSSDIHARWDSVRSNAASIAARWWAHGRWWGNDPDFALCRGPGTSNDPDLARLRPCFVFVKPEMKEARHEPFVLATLSPAEARTLLGLVIISGGAVNFSDDLTKLNSAGLNLLRRTAAAERGDAGVPLDLFEAELPGYWLQRTARGHRVLMINWEDKAVELSLDLGKLGIACGEAMDFWTGRRVAVRRLRITRSLPPRSSILVEV